MGIKNCEVWIMSKKEQLQERIPIGFYDPIMGNRFCNICSLIYN